MYFCIDGDGFCAYGNTLNECMTAAIDGGLVFYANDEESIFHTGLKFFKCELIKVTLIPAKTIPARITELKHKSKTKKRGYQKS